MKPQISSARPLWIKPHKILIAVCTHKRPKMLTLCLESLLAQSFSALYEPSIVVIDNDPKRSAHTPFIHVAASLHEGVELFYLSEPVRGIARARNRAMDYAKELNFDYLAFVDDDEIAEFRWLAGLMHEDYLDVPILEGQQVIMYDGIPEWARPSPSRGFSRLEGEGIKKASTANLRLSRALIQSPLRFNEGLGLGGGEDAEFVRRAVQLRFRAVHTQRAKTFEQAHPERMTMWGQYQRARWLAASYMRNEIQFGRAPYRRLIHRLPLLWAKAGLYMLIGAHVFPVSPYSSRRIILKGLRNLAKAQGQIAAVLGHVPQSYTKTVGA